MGSVMVTRREFGEEKELRFSWGGKKSRFPGEAQRRQRQRPQAFVWKVLTDIFLILCQKNGVFKLYGILQLVGKGFLDTSRKKVKKDFFQLCGVDGASVGGKTYKNLAVMPCSVIWQAVRGRISWQQWETEISPLFPEPFARKA